MATKKHEGSMMSNPENLDAQHEKMKNGLAKELGSKGGKAKKGSKHLSTIIREIGENIDWSKTTLKNKDELKAKYGNNGWQAVCYVAWTKAMAGDPQAMKWLAENGFGKNIDITSDGKALNVALVEFVDSADKQD